MRMQALIEALFPPRCLTCEAAVASDFGLCPACWRDTPFVAGPVCGKCGLPVMGGPVVAATVADGAVGDRATSDPSGPGPAAQAPSGVGRAAAVATDTDTGGAALLCEDCHRRARPWCAGRTALLYAGNGRRVVLALKHGDRMDLARPAARWLARAAVPLIRPGMIVVPVPLHWARLARRRYNQSALLAAALARAVDLAHCPDALVRRRRTPSQEGRSRDERFANLDGAIGVHPRRRARILGRPVLVVDDVMTSGATFTAATAALKEEGAGDVFVLSLARVANAR